MNANLTKICPHCRSDNIGMEATVSWNVFNQAWEIGTIYDGAAFCNTCGRDQFEPLTCEGADKDHHFAAHKASGTGVNTVLVVDAL